MIELSLKTGFARIERTLQWAAGGQLRFAAAQALNDIARAARDAINERMGEIFDNPTPFTRRAVVAPRELAARKEHLVATVTVRPVQSRYLLREEIGGTRTAAENVKPSAALVLPGRALTRNAFGNIPRGILRGLARQSKRKTKHGDRAGTVVFLPAGVPANKAHIGGYFRRTAGGLSRLTVFEEATHYEPRFHFRDRVAEVARRDWAETFRRRFAEAIETAR